MKVLVIGAGVGGQAAAVAAGRSGADVTLLEGTASLRLNHASLPQVLSAERPSEQLHLVDGLSLLKEFGVEVRLSERVLSADSRSHTAQTVKGRVDFDSLVLATGARFVDHEVKGASKCGVFVLRSLDDYLALRASHGSLSHIVVTGSAPLSLMVAQSIPRRSKVRVFLGTRGLHRFSPGIAQRVAQAATAEGFELVAADIGAIVGTGRVEAVISDGNVYPCDAVVMVPRSSPLLPPIDCELGGRGGALVDRSMRTSSRDVYAAGDCAELRLGSASLPFGLHSSSRVMGEVAGLNASGASLRTRLTASMALDLFGVEVCSAGIGVEEGAYAGLDLAQVDLETEVQGVASAGGRFWTTIVYDGLTQRVRGMQVAGKGALSLSEFVSLAVSLGVGLDDLAYLDSPYLPSLNRDRSPIALTAGKALAHVQERRIDAQGTDLRHR